MFVTLKIFDKKNTVQKRPGWAGSGRIGSDRFGLGRFITDIGSTTNKNIFLFKELLS